jgi:uncharacterized protein (DUF58 family)
VRRWTRKAIGWTAGGIIALLLGLWRQDIPLVAMGIVLALFILVAYARRTPEIIVKRRPSRLRVLEGDLHDMTFKVGAKGGWADMVEVHDIIPGYMRLEKGSNHMVLPLYKGEVRTTGYELECPLRGAYRVGPVEMRTTDAQGFFDQEELIPGAHELDVVPLYVELRSLDLTSRALKYNMGPVTINEMGRSTDFYSIREYVRGDPYRKINWKASARYRKLMINEDEKETLSDCAIIVDSRALAATGTPLDNFHETSLRSTLGVARTLVSSKNRVMVATYNDSVNIVPPGLGTAHNRIIQAMLVETVARGNLTFDWAAGYATPFIKPRSDIVVFSPLISDMTFLPAVLGLIRTGHQVVVVTTQLEDFEEMATGEPSSRGLLIGLQRSTNIAELESAGVQVIEVGPEEPQLSIVVRVSAALGGEHLDVAALEEGEAEELPEFEEDLIPTVLVGPRGPVPQELQDEVMGFKFRFPLLIILQVIALASISMAAMMNFYLSEDVWDSLGDAGWGPVMDGTIYALLVGTGLSMAWGLNMLLGYLKYSRTADKRNNLAYLAYFALTLIIMWHIGALIINYPRAGGLQAVVRDIVMLPLILGGLAVFRRSMILAVMATVLLVGVGLAYGNPMDEAWYGIVMAIALVSYVELTWGVVRFDKLHDLSEPVPGRGRGFKHLEATMHRYITMFGIAMAITGFAASIIVFLPGWAVGDPVEGIPHPIDATTMVAPVQLLLWLVVLAVVGRWALISFLDTEYGQGIVDRLRGRLMLPPILGNRRGREEVIEVEGVPSQDVTWDEEMPPPEVPVPHA